MKNTFLSIAIGSLLSTPLLAQELSINISNLTHGNHFTPILVAAHTANNHLYTEGASASDSLQAMAEGGDLSALLTDLNAIAADTVSADGLTAPAMSQSFDLSTQDNNTHLSIVAMVLPTNDGFVGADSIEIPTSPGSYEYYLNAYDAGTEVNDEIINGGGAAGVAGIPADPLKKNGSNASGVTDSEENTLVHIHRGVLGDTDSLGGKSDLDSRIHRWLNPVAKLTIIVK